MTIKPSLTEFLAGMSIALLAKWVVQRTACFVRPKQQKFQPKWGSLMKLVKALSALTLSLFIGNLASAAVIDSADVNGLKTFKDTNTGRIWLDVNNFFDAGANDHATGIEMLSIAQKAGFTFATKSDLEVLLNPLGYFDPTDWAEYAAIMGHSAPRQLIWGMYDDGSSPYGWAYAFADDGNWTLINDVYDPTSKVNEFNSGSRDLGLWAYRVEATVPEPTSIALIALGVGGLLASRRRKRQTINA